MNFSSLPTITGGIIIRQNEDVALGPLLLDSRELRLAPGSIFFAIQGKNHDSHHFLEEIYEHGIRQFVVEKAGDYAQLPQANVIQVPNGIEALQRIAAYHRQQFQLVLLAITGSNAKTIIKEWISQILEQQYVVARNPKSYNSQVGVPLSVWQISDAHEYGVFEAGISLPGEMAKLARILKPTRGLFTNMGPAHDQGFESRVQKIYEKALLFQSCDKIYYCLDHEPIDEVLTEIYQRPGQLVSWSFQSHTSASYYVRKQPGDRRDATKITVKTPQEAYVFQLPFRDAVSVENATHCVIILLEEGLDKGVIQAGLNKLKAVPMRLSLKQGINNCQVIDDTYNNDLAGMQVALDFMLQQKKVLHRVVILSDLLQTGLPAEQLYTQIAQLLKEKQVTHLVGIGDDITTHAAMFAGLDARCYPHVQALLAENLQQCFSDAIILVKGARSFGLEKVVKSIQRKQHSTVLEVDMDAVGHNLNFFRKQLTDGTKLMVMVKALAYGSSSYEIAQLLQHHRVDYLAVAYVDEGVSLREHGITLPIMVMNPTPDSFDKLLTYHLEPEVYSIALLQYPSDSCQSLASSVLGFFLYILLGN
ncbi:MAG: alanine racemase, partial [Bacteroidota bacterium]